jgi:hypothetical protein
MRFRSEVISAERVEVLAHQRRCQTENVVIAALALSSSPRRRSNLDPFKLALVKTELEGRVDRRLLSRV